MINLRCEKEEGIRKLMSNFVTFVFHKKLKEKNFYIKVLREKESEYCFIDEPDQKHFKNL